MAAVCTLLLTSDYVRLAGTGLSHLPDGAPNTAARGLAPAEALLHLVHRVDVVPGSAGTPP